MRFMLVFILNVLTAYTYSGVVAGISLLSGGPEARLRSGGAGPVDSRINRVLPECDWTPFGDPINGKNEGDEFGVTVALSRDGGTVAIGSPEHDGSAEGARVRGSVRILRRYTLQEVLNASIDELKNRTDYLEDIAGNMRHLQDENINPFGGFEPIGELEGLADLDRFGAAIALSEDGNILAVGGTDPDVLVYRYQGSSSWTQTGVLTDVNGRGDPPALALSANGEILAVGFSEYNSGQGRVRAYRYENNAFRPMGQDLVGEGDGDNMGGSISLSSDGRTMAVGSSLHDGNGQNSGHVQFFRFETGVIVSFIPSWYRISTIDGEAAGDRLGVNALSADGLTVAVGAWHNDNANGDNTGHVRVFRDDRFLGVSSWRQIGEDIDRDPRDLDALGGDGSLAISADGKILAVGTPTRLGLNGDTESGYVRIYHVDIDDNQLRQLGADIVVGGSEDLFGSSVALSSDGTTLAVGAPSAEDYSGTTGYVQFFNILLSCLSVVETSMPVSTPFPTQRPTSSPTKVPTFFPTTFSTLSPTQIPTTAENPALSPTQLPTVPPTPLGPASTGSPSKASNDNPPMEPTNRPTQDATVTLAPTSQAEAGTEQRARFVGVTMDFVNVDKLTPQEIATFEAVTKDWYEAYYSNLEISDPDSVKARGLTTSVSVTDQNLVATESTNTIQYDQTLVYVALDNTLSARDYLLRPFLNAQAKADYTNRLQTIDAFRNVQDPIPTPNIPIESEVSDGSGGSLSTATLIGIIVGSLVVVAVGVVGWATSRMYRKRRQPDSRDVEGHGPPTAPMPTTDNHLPVATEPTPSGQTVVAVPWNEAAAAPTFKDQTRNAPPEGRSPHVPLAAAKPSPDYNVAGPLPTFKNQSDSVNRARRQPQQVPLADNVQVVASDGTTPQNDRNRIEP